jgi:Tfp pilus assembly protein FimT
MAIPVASTHVADAEGDVGKDRAKSPAVGYSLLERLTVVGMLGIIAAIGFPAAQSLRRERLLSSARRDTAGFVLQARSMAIRTGSPITVELSSPTQLSIHSAAGSVVGSMSLGGRLVTLSSTATSFTFDAGGSLSEGSAVVLTLATPPALTKAMTIDPAGRIVSF